VNVSHRRCARNALFGALLVVTVIRSFMLYVQEAALEQGAPVSMALVLHTRLPADDRWEPRAFRVISRGEEAKSRDGSEVPIDHSGRVSAITRPP
jgi:hypothetical protein